MSLLENAIAAVAVFGLLYLVFKKYMNAHPKQEQNFKDWLADKKIIKRKEIKPQVTSFENPLERRPIY